MFDDYSDDPIYNVKAIALQSGVKASTLRAWERRYGVPKPDRTGSGYRLYSSRDIATIRWLKTQIESGMSISQAVSLLYSMQQATRQHSSNVAPAKVVSVATGSEVPKRLTDLHDQMVANATIFGESSIEAALQEAFSIYAVEDVCINLIQPVLITVGEQWHRGEISINVERFFSNVIRRKLMVMLDALAPPIRKARIIVGCAPGELHEMGILMLALFLRRRGYDVIYLGQSIAVAGLDRVLQTLQPQGMLLSAGTLSTAASLIDVAGVVIQQGYRSMILAYGGHIFNTFPDLRFLIPGHLLSTSALKAVNALEEIFESKTVTRMHLPPRAREMQDALIALRANRVTIIADMADNTRRLGDRASVIDIAEHLLIVLESAVRLEQPAVLQDVHIWEWDTRLLIDLPQLSRVVHALDHAIRRNLPECATALSGYIAALRLAVTLDKE